MLRSMTGYGRSEAVSNNRKFAAEIKSVNHRYLDLNIKLPRAFNPFEDKIRKLLSKSILRGKTDVYISFETLSKDDIKLTLNEALADAYIEQLENLCKRCGLSENSIGLELVAKFPDMISVEKNLGTEETLHELWEGLLPVFEATLRNFIAMREKEGEALKADILNKAGVITKLTEKIEQRSPHVLEDYRQKLTDKVTEALAGVEIDESRLLAECVIYADKSCVDEELTRLKSHIAQLAAILEQEGGVGRKLDFLVQEMNREVNTIGSKSNDMEITRIIVELKSEVEKIREQIQNLE